MGGSLSTLHQQPGKFSKTVHSRCRLPPATDTTPGKRRNFIVVRRGSNVMVHVVVHCRGSCRGSNVMVHCHGSCHGSLSWFVVVRSGSWWFVVVFL